MLAELRAQPTPRTPRAGPQATGAEGSALGTLGVRQPLSGGAGVPSGPPLKHGAHSPCRRVHGALNQAELRPNVTLDAGTGSEGGQGRWEGQDGTDRHPDTHGCGGVTGAGTAGGCEHPTRPQPVPFAGAMASGTLLRADPRTAGSRAPSRGLGVHSAGVSGGQASHPSRPPAQEPAAEGQAGLPRLGGDAHRVPGTAGSCHHHGQGARPALVMQFLQTPSQQSPLLAKACTAPAVLHTST